jgi:hypothetical protein
LCSAALVCLSALSPVGAQSTDVTLTDIGPAAPTPGPIDISQLLNTSQNDDGINYYTDNGASYGAWCGQTFATGTNLSGYVMNSLAIKAAGNGNGFSNIQLYDLRVYILSAGGTIASLVASYTAYGGGTENDWFKWVGIHVVLAPNTQYAYTVGGANTAIGWQHLANQGGNPYANGQICTIPLSGGPVTYGATGTSDAAFDAGLSFSQAATAASITVPLQSLRVYAGETVSFTATGINGTAPLTYQWQYNGTHATNVSNIFGVATPSLTISNVTAANAGSYQLLVSNPGGTTASTVATLTVVTPVPGSYESAVLADAPLTYWKLNETNGNPAGGGVVAYDYANGLNGVYQNGAQNGFDGVLGPQPPAFPGFPSNNTAMKSFVYTTHSYMTASAGPLTANTVTYAMWINPSGPVQNWAGLLMSRPPPGTGGDGFGFGGETDGTGMSELAYTWNHNNSDTWGFSSFLFPPANQWSFVALVIAPTTATIYLISSKGVQTAVNPIPHTRDEFAEVWHLGDDVDVGESGGVRTFPGIISSASVFLSSLSSNQLVALYNAGLAPQMTWPVPADISYGMALTPNQLDATANISGTLAYTPSIGTVLNAGTNTLSVIFTPTGAVDHSSVTDSVSLVVTSAPLTVTAANASRQVGAPNPAFTGTITGLQNSDSITATYSSSATSSSPEGTYSIVPSLNDPNDRQTNYTVSLVNGVLVVGRPALAITWPIPDSITYGTALSSNQLNATANLPGSFAYNPVNGAVLNSGLNTLSVIFTPTDTNDYNSVTDSVSLVVSPASLTVTAANATRQGGAPNPAFTGTITGLQNGDNIMAAYNCSASASSPAGTYPILPSLVDPNNRQTNYTVSLVNGTLTVTSAHISSEAYTFTTFAGTASTGSADGAGTDAEFFGPYGVAVDSAGNAYVADTFNQTIRKVSPTGVVATLAGLAGSPGSEDGTGSAARFNDPYGVAVDSNGNVYVADSGNNTIRRIRPVGTNWVVSTIAGLAGILGSTDGTGTIAQFNEPSGVAVDRAGNVYVADSGNDTIREVTPVGTNWVVTTLAGLADIAGSADGIGSVARFWHPEGVAVDSADNVYVGDFLNNTIRKLTPDGVTTLAGLAGSPGGADGTGSAARFNDPYGVAVDGAGNVYVADSGNNTVRKITSPGLVTTVAGSGSTSQGGADGTGSEARFYDPYDVAVDGSGNVYVADEFNSTIREITSLRVVSTIAGSAGNYGTNDGVGTDTRFYLPQAVAVDSAGNVYVADTWNETIRKVTSEGVVSTLAGSPGLSGSADGTGSDARFWYPEGVAVDSSGNVYVADTYNATIRKVTSAGVVTTLVGMAGYIGANDGTGSDAQFLYPHGVAVDSNGNVYVADSGNNTIREIIPVGTTWLVSTIAGLAGIVGSTDGAGSAALFDDPLGVAVDTNGNVYVADSGNNTIREITPVGTTWLVSTIAGSAGIIGSTDGVGSAALFNFPVGVAVDSAGNVYVADTYNNTIRKGVFSQYTSALSVPFTPPPTTGQLMVTLQPPEASGQWRLPWEAAWRDSGTTATNLARGEYAVEFRDIPGYLAIPLSGPVAVTNGGTTFLTNQYFPTIIPSDTTSGGGTLTVNIGPSPPGGAGWRFLGDTNSFYPPGYGTNLLSGTYLIQFAPVAGFITPASLSVEVAPGVPTVLSITYLLAQSPPNNILLPMPVPAGNISDLTDYPFGFNGQLQTDVGYGSGVAVQTNVVLTAAHLIFNDQTLSYVSQAYWFYQEEAGVFTPDPLPARGWYLLSGYAAQRTNDVLGGLGPEQSSPQSRNLDVAALYFQSPVANGSYGGWLPSDASPNSWLTSTAEKMLVGYPVDGSQFGFTNIVNGEMYEIGPQPYPLSQATDPVADQQVYTASWMLGYPGNSGGPLYVEYNGYYYPAGVYLGTLFNGIVPQASAVRAIDSNVVNLITLAASLGDSGTNNSGGGVITIIPSQATSLNNPGYLILQLGPPAAVQAGAAWELAGQPANYYSTANPSLQEITSTNALTVQFKPIPGWNLPTNRSVTVVPGVILTNVANYTVTNPLLTLDLVNGLRISGTTNTAYQLQSNSTLTGTWIPFKTNTLTNFGFNLITNKPRPGFYRALWLTNSP